MTFYWTLKSIPELTQLPARMRWRAWYACVDKTFRHWQTWLACAAAVAPILVFLFLGLLMWPASSSPAELASHDEALPVFLAALGVFLLSLPGILIFGQIQSEIIRPYLRAYLAARNKVSDDTTS